MATNRKIVFRNGEIYHVFNRGLDRRNIFTTTREFERIKQLIKFYRHKKTPSRFSQVMQQPKDIRKNLLENLYKSEKLVDVLAFCLMPNHFHFLLRQNSENGLTKFVANATNAYTKYFNTRYKRVGPILEGVFKAVLVETDEQLIHLSRYIHLNPVVSSIIEENQLNKYSWSSYPEYLSLSEDGIVEKAIILAMFKSVKDYQKYVVNQIDYAKKLEAIKHLAFE